MLLAPRASIAAVSYLARDPMLSPMAEQARQIPVVRGQAEEVLQLDPDLVITSPFSTRATVDLLRRLGRRVVLVPLAQDIEGVRNGLRQVGAAIGSGPDAERMIAAFDQRLAKFEARRSDQQPSALVYGIAGIASGPGSLADSALRAAGLVNAAASLRLDAKGALPLELLLARAPDLLVLGTLPDDNPTVQADNLRHPALTRLQARIANVHVPQNLLFCATPHVADAIALLIGARAGLAKVRS